MADAPFQTLQRRFAAHLRDPHRHPAPAGVEERRLKIYRELFFNNIQGFLDRAFPVLRSLYEEPEWQRLARTFFDRHACRTPYFVEIPGEFVRFLEQDYTPLPQDPPFLTALAHYEWLELVLDTAADAPPEPDVDAQGDLYQGVPYLSPLRCVASYPWPVHRISADFQPREPLDELVWLLVYRDREDTVGFMEINAATARLLAVMQARPTASGEQVLRQLANELGATDPAPILAFGKDLLARLRQRDILLGARRATEST
ncbi:DUF2063 domain-containing protein [Alcanivorax sp. N3-2A]|nr:DUF2063 domain-containing protein [Alcanivorax sp. N3-2A]